MRQSWSPYAYRPERVRSVASFQTQQAARLAGDNIAEQRASEAFRCDLTVSTETNCGTVIQIRGPMIEIAVPPAGDIVRAALVVAGHGIADDIAGVRSD